MLTSSVSYGNKVTFVYPVKTSRCAWPQSSDLSDRCAEALLICHHREGIYANPRITWSRHEKGQCSKVCTRRDTHDEKKMYVGFQQKLTARNTLVVGDDAGSIHLQAVEDCPVAVEPARAVCRVEVISNARVPGSALTDSSTESFSVTVEVPGSTRCKTAG